MKPGYYVDIFNDVESLQDIEGRAKLLEKMSTPNDDLGDVQYWKVEFTDKPGQTFQRFVFIYQDTFNENGDELKECINPHCGNTGAYPVEPDGEPEQCEFCYEEPLSKFNQSNKEPEHGQANQEDQFRGA